MGANAEVEGQEKRTQRLQDGGENSMPRSEVQSEGLVLYLPISPLESQVSDPLQMPSCRWRTLVCTALL